MKRTVKAILRWRPPEEGGRASLPVGASYSTAARFSGQNEPWPQKAWSLVVVFKEKPAWAREQKVEVKFLVDEAPDYLLSKGSEFELMEGKKAVARGQVV